MTPAEALKIVSEVMGQAANEICRDKESGEIRAAISVLRTAVEERDTLKAEVGRMKDDAGIRIHSLLLTRAEKAEAEVAELKDAIKDEHDTAVEFWKELKKAEAELADYAEKIKAGESGKNIGGQHDASSPLPRHASPGLSDSDERALGELHEAAYDGYCHKYHPDEKIWWSKVMMAEGYIRARLAEVKPAPQWGRCTCGNVVILDVGSNDRITYEIGKDGLENVTVQRKPAPPAESRPVKVTREWLHYTAIILSCVRGRADHIEQDLEASLRDIGVEVEEAKPRVSKTLWVKDERGGVIVNPSETITFGPTTLLWDGEGLACIEIKEEK